LEIVVQKEMSDQTKNYLNEKVRILEEVIETQNSTIIEMKATIDDQNAKIIAMEANIDRLLQHAGFH